MFSLLYIIGKRHDVNVRGTHGYLKLSPAQQPDPEKIRGPEIHFRMVLPFNDAARRFFGSEVSHQGRQLALRLKDKARPRKLLEIRDIYSGNATYMQSLWNQLVDHAQQISKTAPRSNGFDVNCHTLVYDLLERVNLAAPRQEYRERVARITSCGNIKPP